jgi:hypothetical protein
MVTLTQIILNQIGLAELGIYCLSTPKYSAELFMLNWYFGMIYFSLFVTIHSYLDILMTRRRRA